MKKALEYGWKKVIAVAMATIVLFGPFSVQVGSVFLVGNYASAATCTSGTLVTPQQNPTFFAQGTAGQGAAYGCNTQSVTDLGVNNQIDFFNSDGTPFGQANTSVNGTTGSVTQTNQGGQSVTSSADCSGVLSYMSSPFTCLWRTATTWIAASLIWIAVTIMVWVGWFFNLAVSQTVLGFNGWVTGGVLTAISTGWTFFRDIANIVIIGLFVFIAISIILGIKSYGQRSFIARVLIVAVLINFSFLFTRIVINFSNALAVQFAKVHPLDASVTPLGATPPDIAGKFTTLMGVQGWSNTKDSLQEIAKNNDSSWIALMHAFMVVVVALGVAIVLLYGAILLVMRALIFIFLLVTSSLAFATYLLPSWASSNFGWKAWWEALFRNALLAPLMMLFLAVTLQISQGMVAALNSSQSASTNSSANGGVGVLGALATHPDDPKNMAALMIYVVVLGLLYGAIRISNKFSGAAGQFAWTGTLPFANAAVAWPSRSLGFLGRNTIGREAQRLGESVQQRAKANYAANRTNWGFVQDKFAQAIKSAAKRDFNAGNLTNVKSAQTKVGGFVGQEKKRKEEIAKRAQRNTYTDAELKTSKEALQKAREEAGSDGRKRGDAYDTNQKQLDAAKKLADAAHEQANVAEKSRDALQKEIQSLKTSLTKAKPDEKLVIEKEIANKEGEMTAETQKITQKRAEAQEHSMHATQLDEEGKSLRELLEKRASYYMPNGEKYIEAAHDAVGYRAKPQSDRAADIAVNEAFMRFSNTLNRIAGQTVQDDKWAQSLHKATKDNIHHEEQNKQLKEIVKELKKVDAHTEDAAHKAHEDASKTNEHLKDIKHSDH